MTPSSLSSTVSTEDICYARVIEALSGHHILLRADPPKFTIIAVSELHFELTSSSRINIIGKGLFEAYSTGKDGEKVLGEQNLRASLQNVLQFRVKDSISLVRYDLPDRNGNLIEKHWQVENSPIIGDDGNVHYILHTSEDLTEVIKSRENEERLQLLERDYRLFLQAPVIIGIIKGKDLILEFANNTFLEFWGKTSKIVGTSVMASIPEMAEYGLVNRLEEVNQTGQSFVADEVPIQIVHDDRIRYLNFYCQPFFTNAPSEPSGIFLVANEVTEQVEARLHVEEVKERLNFRNALLEAQNEATPDGVLVVNAKEEIVLYNKRFLDIWKIPDSIVGSHSDKTAVEYASRLVQDPEGFIQKVKALYASGLGPSSDEIILKDGRIIERDGSPIIAENGLRYGWAWYFRDITERVNQEVKIKNIIQQSADPILVLKGEELILEIANKALLELWLVDESAIGKPFLEILPEMRDQPYLALLKKVLHTGESFYGNEEPAFFIRKGKRETRYFNFSYQPYRNVHGTITGILIMATDVTERVHAKFQIEQKEISFKNLLMQAPVGICILKTTEFIVELANDSYLTIVQRQREEFIGRSIWISLPEVKEQGFDRILKKVLKTGETFVGHEFKVDIFRNGKEETIYVDFVYEPLREVDGSIERIMVIAIDTTSNVLYRNKIEEAEERARLAIESAELGTFELDLPDNSVICSNRLNEIFGIANSNDFSKYLAVVHPDDLGVRDLAFKEAFKTGRLAYDARIICPEKDIRWIRVKGKVFLDLKGIPKKVIGVIQDITELKSFAEKLQRTVEERTRELQLLNNQLKRSNEELEQYAYVSSHDLQEPLRKIHYFNDQLQIAIGTDSPLLPYCHKIQVAAKRMSGLIHSLLDYSSITKKVATFEATDLNVVLHNVITDYDLLIEQKNATLEIGHLSIIESIPLQINQLFFNLLGNALKFTRKNNNPIIKIWESELNESDKMMLPEVAVNDYIKIVISDNGIGFSQDYADHIFAIFQRLNDRSVYSGYGIGLALCKKIVEGHNGFIYASGEPAKGASFSMILPKRQIIN